LVSRWIYLSVAEFEKHARAADMKVPDAASNVVLLPQLLQAKKNNWKGFKGKRREVRL